MKDESCSQQPSLRVPVWPFAYGGPTGQGKIRELPEDFKVEEILAFEPEGSGEHFFLLLEKTGENTEFVARQIARFTGVRQRDIGYAGLKDRYAVTRQWFSVWLPGALPPDWSQFNSDSINVLEHTKHQRKLHRGALSGNIFEIRIRDWRGDRKKLEQQLRAIQISGIPNYFGPQRFGNKAQNVSKAQALFNGSEKIPRHKRSLYLSAARSFVFNHVLAERVINDSWNQAIAGDILMLSETHSVFKLEEPDSIIKERIQKLELHPTGPLSGIDGIQPKEEAEAIESQVSNAYQSLITGLKAAGLKSERRALRVPVKEFSWKFQSEEELQLNFILPAGSYATSLLRELIEI